MRILAGVLIAAAATSSQCDSKPTPLVESPTVTVTHIGTVGMTNVYKFCDGKRLVYVADRGNGGAALATVEAAPECLQ